MATPMPTDWEPPHQDRSRHDRRRRTGTGRAPWEQWADGRWWLLKRGEDIDPDEPLVIVYRRAWMWADYRAQTCEGRWSETDGELYLRIGA
jgi:hypothetical protein